MRYWQKALTITWKDTLSELRTKEIISSVLVFTLLVIIIFNFAFSAGPATARLVAPGILWATFAFAGVLGLNRSFIPEKEEGCLEGLMMCPVNREVIYWGKMLSSLLFMLVIESIALPIFALLFNVPVISWPLITVTFLATVGFVSVGSLFSALAVNTRARELVLPILFLPIVVPVVIGAVKVSEMALSGQQWSNLLPWLGIIMAFDAIFLVVSYIIFPFVIEE